MRALLLALCLAAPGLAGCFAPEDPPALPHEEGFPEPDADRLLDLVRAQVLDANGTTRYRIPGTTGLFETADWIAGELGRANATVRFHDFAADYRCSEEVPMRNVVGTLPGATNRTIYLAAHYDTRPVSEKDPDPAKRGLPTPGANDGGSGVAVVLELARLLDGLENRTFTYVFLLFDAEDGGSQHPGDACDTPWAIGSRRFVDDMTAEQKDRFEMLLLFDLVGGDDLLLEQEGYSNNGPAALTHERLWDIAASLGHGDVFVDTLGPSIVDDHVPFLDAGLPAVDIIHLDNVGDVFPATHHTTGDDLSRVSKESLRVVARVAMAWLWEQERG